MAHNVKIRYYARENTTIEAGTIRHGRRLGGMNDV